MAHIVRVSYIYKKNIRTFASAIFSELPNNMPPLESRKKVELHVHLDGSVRPSTVWDIAKKRGQKLPASTPEEFTELLRIPIHKAQTLTELLQKFFIYMPIIAGYPEAIYRMAYEFCEDLAKDKVCFAEVRYSPHLLSNSLVEDTFALTHGSLTPRQVVDIINNGLMDGCKDFDIRVNSILCCMRQDPEWSEDVLNLCVEYRDKGVVGIDLAGDENLTKKFPTQKEHIEVFQNAAKLGIHRTVHAGENGPASNIKEAVFSMIADRIGHGYHVVQDEELYQQLLDRNIHFEICPLSSFLTGAVPLDYEQHPLHRFAADGANFSINTDDPTISGVYLLGEYKFAKEHLLISEKNLLLSNINAAKSAFLPEDEKRNLIALLKEEYNDELTAFGIEI